MQLFKRALSEFSNDNAMTLAAAVAFYAALSIAPLIILLLWVASFLGADTREQLVDALVTGVGEQAGAGVRTIIETTQANPSAANWAGLFGILTLLVSATAVFGQLQFALNRIWNVQSKRGTLMNALRKRLLGLLVMFSILIVLLAWIVLDSVLAAMVGDQQGSLWLWISTGASLLVYSVLFALVYKVLPDVEISWGSLWVGALLTAVLFTLGKLALGFYLGHSSMGSTYGAAGSLVVLMVFFYYSAVIIFFGAELTQAYAQRRGERLEPAAHAVRLQPARPLPT